MSVGEEKSGGLDGGSVGRRRRRWSEAQKRQIVAETHEPGVSVPMVAQRYNLNANQIFRWRRLFRESERAGVAGRFVPVVVEAAPGQEPAAAAMSPPSESIVAEGQPATGRMEIVLAGGRRVIVDRAVDGPALARVIAVLERR
ncbi:MAG: transposase [Rhodospirillales bacterium]|nr:transposase [Rhodospirillales bacterium]MDE0379094.1 transposase [Rhodospirillales bacterium]